MTDKIVVMSLPTPPSKSLVWKLAEVMSVVERVPKRGRNDFHKYDYATEADIAQAIRQALAERHILLIPEVTKYLQQELGPNKKGEARDPLTVLDMVFTFRDGETGESLAQPWVGIGQDGGDKGVYKAMTGAEKYFLLKTFLIPTGDDPEHDNGAGKRPRQVTVEAPTRAPAISEAAEPLAEPPAGATRLQRSEARETSRGKAYWLLVDHLGVESVTWIPQLGSLAEQVIQDQDPLYLSCKGQWDGKPVVTAIRRIKRAVEIENTAPLPDAKDIAF